ncbi:hypothetical protein GMRT_11119 [Giardia muris]|uniref:Uncharacterized protein n=1 Tax=Giardia muris TaxID=5742 RepID=A0A4Z1SZQ7_GIAMU|nr:hypothetical protein GMRT_11119 [Giardia muris]|eukprot:TNJ28938.1 hypothetical protein GMRT_11119 [Giardia muris]
MPPLSALEVLGTLSQIGTRGPIVPGWQGLPAILATEGLMALPLQILRRILQEAVRIHVRICTLLLTDGEKAVLNIQARPRQRKTRTAMQPKRQVQRPVEIVMSDSIRRVQTGSCSTTQMGLDAFILETQPIEALYPEVQGQDVDVIGLLQSTDVVLPTQTPMGRSNTVVTVGDELIPSEPDSISEQQHTPILDLLQNIVVIPGAIKRKPPQRKRLQADTKLRYLFDDTTPERMRKSSDRNQATDLQVLAKLLHLRDLQLMYNVARNKGRSIVEGCLMLHTISAEASLAITHEYVPIGMTDDLQQRYYTSNHDELEGLRVQSEMESDGPFSPGQAFDLEGLSDSNMEGVQYGHILQRIPRTSQSLLRIFAGGKRADIARAFLGVLHLCMEGLVKIEQGEGTVLVRRL